MTGDGVTVLPPKDDAALRVLAIEFATGGIPELVFTDGSRIRLPEQVAEVLRDVVIALAEGQAVTVLPHHTVLTAQQAADLLGVSRPTLVKLLDDGVLPFTQPARHRRVRLSDVLAHRDRVRAEHDADLDELVALSQEAGLYGAGVMRARPRR